MKLNHKTTEELQAELDVLLVETKTLKKQISDAESAKKRLSELYSWDGLGLVARKRQELENSKYPIYDSDKWNTRRIVDVDAKYISIKNDSRNTNDANKYKRENGWLIRSRSDSGAIDPVKAIEIWEAHNAAKKSD